MMMLFAESGHPVFRATSPSSRGPLEKHGRWKNVEKLQRGLDDGRAFYFAASCPFISSVSTEPWRIGVKILLSESQLILHQAQEPHVDNTESSLIRGRIEPYQTTNVQYGSPRKLGAAAQGEIQKLSRRSSTHESLR